MKEGTKRKRERSERRVRNLLTCGIASLNHESFDVSVKYCFVIISTCTKSKKILQEGRRGKKKNIREIPKGGWRRGGRGQEEVK